MISESARSGRVPMSPQWIRKIIPDRDWISLKRLGEHRAVRSSYFWIVSIPLLAKLLSKLDSEYVIHCLGTQFTITTGLPTSWRIFYFSSVAMALATATYSFFCPRIISSFANFGEFEGNCGSEYRLRFEAVTLSQKTGDETTLAEFVRWFCTAGDGNDHMQINYDTVLNSVEIQKEKMSDAFEFLRQEYAFQNSTARSWCTRAYLVAGILLLVVFLKAFWFVIWFVATRPE
jgi:hypothetical protein